MSNRSHLHYPKPSGSGIVICTHFGCGKQLTLIEQLAGKFCSNHMKRSTLDITFIIKNK